MLLPICFEIPKEQAAIDIVREWAFSLQDGTQAGQHYVRPSLIDDCIQLVVMVPQEVSFYKEALWTLVRVNLWTLQDARQRHVSYQMLYDSACYLREKGDDEIWQSIRPLYIRKVGDCEDLACARVAERLVIGDACRPALIEKERLYGVMYHVVVVSPSNGRLDVEDIVEDPSKILGMMGDTNGDSNNSRCIGGVRLPSSGQFKKGGNDSGSV